MIANNPNATNNPGPVIPLQHLDHFTSSFFDLLKKTVRTLHLKTLETVVAFTERYASQFQSQT